MKRIWMFSALILLAGCSPVEEETDPLPVYDLLQIQPRMDSVFLAENNESRQFTIVGSLLNVTERTITNKGVISSTKYIVREVDTVLQYVDPGMATWRSSNPSVATVSRGLVTGKSPGTALITTSIGDVVSPPVVVNVRAVHTAPGLSLDPPDFIFILQNFTSVSGTVQNGAILRVTEPNSGFNAPNVSYSSNGAYSQQVTGLKEGINVITVRATNPNDATKYTERSKGVVYFAPNTIGANAIVGNWLGTTLGKNFNFTISNSVIPTRYDISGTIEIDFKSVGLGLGTVKDINLTGILDHNGSINVALSKEVQGYKISGTFKGNFSSAGTGKGSYSAQAVKSGWPKISFNDVWTAVKQ
jgi:hypothetical protein